MSVTANTPGRLISVEGISGTGKTYLLKNVAARTDGVVIIGDAFDHVGANLERMILDALRRTNDRFLRGGSPQAETLMLLALKTDQYFSTIAPALAAGRVVVEDRSLDSTAVYQALILADLDVDAAVSCARDIYDQAIRWRPAPDVTFLIHDDFDVALARANDRETAGYSDDEQALLRGAHELYLRHSAAHADRIAVLDRRQRSEQELTDALTGAVNAARQSS